MATQQYINYGAEPNDGTGDPLRDAFIKVDENFSNLWASGPVASNITITNNTISVLDTNGNLVLSPNGIGIIQTKNNIIPSIGNVYSLGSSSLYYRSAYLGPGGVYSTGNITTTGYFIGDGSQLSNISVAGGSSIVNGNSNVVVAANSSVTIGIAGVSNVVVFNTSNIEVNGLITATGNVTGNYILGNGSQLTGLSATYGNADVSNFLASGNNTSNITTTANIAGTYFLGNGSQLTGLPVQYSNANVTTLLANFGSNVISTTGNITAGYFVGNGLLLTNITAGNIVGTVANATYALNANAATYSINATQANVANVANSVAGANVSGTVSSATTAGTVTTNAQPNITSVGNLESLIVTGNITSSANISGAYILGNGSQLTGLPALYGNANVANYLPTYSGNLNPGNLTATGNVTGGNVITDNIVGTTITITSNGAINLSSIGNVTVNSKNITGLANPVQDQDAATKSYVDSVAQGLDPKASVSLATATTLPVYTYNNGTAGVGATITGSASGLLTIDGTAPTVGDRVLIKNESGGNAPYNGIYVVTTNDAGSSYVLTRSTDMNQAAEVPGAFVFVELGAVNADSGYVCTTNAPVVIGTTNIVWTQFSSAGSYTANTSAGLNLVGSQFNAKVDETTTAFDGTGNIIVKASATLITPNIGNATGNSLILSGNGLISATTATLSGNVLAGNVNSNADVTGTTITASGNLVGGNVNITSTVNTVTVVASGNINAGNLITSGILSVTGNANVGNLGATNVVATNLTGTLTTAAQTNITSVGSLGALTVTGNVSGGNLSTLGNVSANYYLGNGSQLTGVVANSANAETLTGTFLANNVIGSSLTSVGTLGNLTVTGNVSSGNVSGTNGTFTNVAGTLTTAAQTNITSVGSLSGLTVSNTTGVVDFSNTANVTLGNVSNLHITGGVNGYVLSTDGTGNLSWVADGVGNVVGNAIQIGTPTNGNLTTNVAYDGWTTSTYVTDGLDDLNQVSLNIANSTYVGHSDFTANVTSGSSPMAVAFTSTFVGNATNYLWDFGDSTTSSSRNPTKTYSDVLGGTFTVSFTAWNTSGTYSGNAALGAKGSVDSVTKTGFIVLFTPLPIPSFTTSPTSLDTGSSVTLTNTSQYATSFTINYGDGNSAVNPGNSWITDSHTYINSANTDALRSITLTGTNQTAGNAPPYSVTSSATNVKIYSEQSPAVTANVLTTINYLTTSGGVVSFRNDTPGSPGNTASFGAQQVYNFQWGDSTSNSNVNIQTGLAGNPSAANITHTFALSSAQQNAATTVSRVANLWLYTGHSTSPFKSANITISIEPEVRAGFIGTANIQTDATGFTSNAQVGYLYTDYNSRDRSLFNFRNDTSPNVAFTGNVFNWTWGDTTSDLGLITFANVTHSYLNAVGSPTTGSKTVTLQANGTPGTISQSNTSTRTSYITILANPTAPPNLSSYTNVTISTASQGTSPLLAAGASDNTGGNLPANGTSVTRVATTTPVATNANVVNANTATTGTLTAYVNNTAAGNVTFTTGGNTVGTAGALIISADRDLHVANAAVPTGFYKVFSATISNTLASLGNGYNDFQLRHSASGNTNTVGMVKDNLNSAPSLVTGNTIMVEAVSGTYRYISGIPYYNTGSPSITIANLELQNFTGQTFRSADPFILGSGTVYEGTGAVVVAQTKALATINNAGNSMLTGSNVKANIGIATNYILGNLTGNINGSNNSVSTLQANIFNVIGTSTTVQLPTKIQAYAGANSGINEQSITCTPTANTQAAIRVVMSTAGNAPAFSDSTNFYVANAWSGAQTIAGTPEAVTRYGVLKHYAIDLSTGYLPVGPNLSTSRSGTQYFTFAFARPSLANFDIRLTTTTGVAGVWIAAPGTTIDKGGFSSPTPGFPGPTSTINGWLEAFTQYAGSGVPGASGTGGNGSNGCALTGADVVPLNSAIANVGYTMTLGSQNAANSTGNNILIRIGLASGQTITDLQIGVAT